MVQGYRRGTADAGSAPTTTLASRIQRPERVI
jgi:hypothetical protein